MTRMLCSPRYGDVEEQHHLLLLRCPSQSIFYTSMVASSRDMNQVVENIRFVIVGRRHQGTWKLAQGIPLILATIRLRSHSLSIFFLRHSRFSKAMRIGIKEQSQQKIITRPIRSFIHIITSAVDLPSQTSSHPHLRGLGAARASALARLAGALLVSAAAVALGLLLAVDLDELHLGLLGGLGAGLDVGVLGAAGAVALAGSALADGALGVAVAGSAVGALDLVEVQVAAALLLEAGEVDGLVVHVEDLLGALVVESTHALAGGGLGGLLEVRRQTPPALVGLLADAVLLVNGLGLLGRLVFAVELLEGLGEAAGDAVLLVEGESLLDSLVREDVAVGEVFCEDAAPGLVLLREIFRRVTLGVTGGLAGSDLLKVRRRGDVDLVGAELGVVEEESGLSGSLFFEAHSV